MRHTPTPPPRQVDPSKLLSSEDSLDSLGRDLRKAATRRISYAIWGGYIATKAFEIHGRRGCESQFGRWVAKWAPHINPRTIDRWRALYRQFSVLAEFRDGRSPDFFVRRFRLGALYALCENGVTEGHRRAAVKLARQGQLITLEVAKQIVREKTDEESVNDEGRQTKRQRLSLKVEGGSVTVYTKDGSFAAVLEAALASLNELEST